MALTHHLEEQPEKKGRVTLAGYPLDTLWWKTSEEILTHPTDCCVCPVHQEAMLGLHFHPTNLSSEVARSPEICSIRKATAHNSGLSCERSASPTFFSATSSVEMLNELQPLNLTAGLSLPPPSLLQQTVGVTLFFCPTAWCSLKTNLSSNTMNNLNKRSVAKKSWFYSLQKG